MSSFVRSHYFIVTVVDLKLQINNNVQNKKKIILHTPHQLQQKGLQYKKIQTTFLNNTKFWYSCVIATKTLCRCKPSMQVAPNNFKYQSVSVAVYNFFIQNNYTNLKI